VKVLSALKNLQTHLRDARQRTKIARDLKVEIGAKQRSNFVVVGARANAGEKLPCNARVFSSTLIIVFLYQG
jgi:hypothetical protein